MEFLLRKLRKRQSRAPPCPGTLCCIANYDAKRQGHPLKQADLGIRLDGELPENKFAVVIDNVIDRGTTAFACANAIGTCALSLTFPQTRLGIAQASLALLSLLLRVSPTQ